MLDVSHMSWCGPPPLDVISRRPSLSDGGCYVKNGGGQPPITAADIRHQLLEQLKSLDVRCEVNGALLQDLQEFFRRRAEVEMEYSAKLDRLVRQTMSRHKEKRLQRESWPQYSTFACWQALVGSTKQTAKDHQVLADVYSSQVNNRLSHCVDDLTRIYKRCRDVGADSHEELLKVLNELHEEMKKYHVFHGESCNAENKLQHVAHQRHKIVEHSSNKEKLEKSRRWKELQRAYDKKEKKFHSSKLQTLKARNDYILSMEAANAAIHKYFVDDLNDLMDCMDLGFHQQFSRAMRTHMSCEECCRGSLDQSIDDMRRCVESLDAQADKQKFLEAQNAAFQLPRRFEFQAHKGDEVVQFSAQRCVQEHLEKRSSELTAQLTQLRMENEEVWKSLEESERNLLAMVSVSDYDVRRLFEREHDPKTNKPLTNTQETNNSEHSNNGRQNKHPMETEDFYLNKFLKYIISSNLITRLEAKRSLIKKHLGEDLHSGSSDSVSQAARPPSLPPKPRKKRIGRTSLTGQPKLFGGSLEEYIEASGQDIPPVLESCIKVINLYGMHHQGIFRISGSQIEINQFRESFERGDDPLTDMTDSSDMNSVAGVLKLYLRELREPVFPIQMFDQLIDCSRAEPSQEFIVKVRHIVSTLPRPVVVVLRYLFSFLNHLSEYSDENMMDGYNLAICFGPTLVPVPEERDQVQYQNSVNELVKRLIIYQEEVFPGVAECPGPTYEKYFLPDDGEELDGTQEDVASDGADLDSELDAMDGCASEEAALLSLLALQLRGCSRRASLKSEVFDAVAQYDFEGRTERELTFHAGANITLHSQVSQDWWQGSIEGRTGLVPDKYISRQSGANVPHRRSHRSSSTSDILRGTKSSPGGRHSSPRSSSSGGRRSHTSSGDSSGGGGPPLYAVVDVAGLQSAPPPPPIKHRQSSESSTTSGPPSGPPTAPPTAPHSVSRSVSADSSVSGEVTTEVVRDSLRSTGSTSSAGSPSPFSKTKGFSLPPVAPPVVPPVVSRQTSRSSQNSRKSTSERPTTEDEIDNALKGLMSEMESLGVTAADLRTATTAGNHSTNNSTNNSSHQTNHSSNNSTKHQTTTATDPIRIPRPDLVCDLPPGVVNTSPKSSDSDPAASPSVSPATASPRVVLRHHNPTDNHLQQQQQQQQQQHRPVAELMNIFKQQEASSDENKTARPLNRRPMVKVKPAVLKKPQPSPEVIRRVPARHVTPHVTPPCQVETVERRRQAVVEGSDREVRISDV